MDKLLSVRITVRSVEIYCVADRAKKDALVQCARIMRASTPRMCDAPLRSVNPAHVRSVVA